MRSAAVIAPLLVLFASLPIFAEDHQVPQSALAELGLGEMKTAAPERGMEVRGRGRLSLAMGLSAVSGILIDQHTGSFIVGGDTNAAKALTEIVGKNLAVESTTQQQSSAQINLEVPSSGFSGTIISIAGGTAFARSN